VAGLSQITADFMRIRPLVIDLGWGRLRSALMNLRDSGFVAPHDASAHRQALVDQYLATFRQVEAGAVDKAKGTFKDLAATISKTVVTDQQGALATLVDGQLAKLA
jgi:hypothetical protein